jgi:hypothetical protein
LPKSRMSFFAVLLILIFALVSGISQRLNVTASPRILSGNSRQAGPQLKTKAVVLIVLDGFRWQEVFGGAAAELMNVEYGGVQDVAQVKKDFWRNTPEERRRVLMPFLWTVIAEEGQIYGNQTKGSIAQVTNGLKFSYPGYNEMSTGYPDPQINSNEFGINPNATVFEWLNQKPAFRDQVAVFGTWNTYNDIFRAKTSGLFVRAGWDLPWASQLNPQEQRLKTLYETTTRIEDDDTFDSFAHQDLLDYLGGHNPRALFVGYGGTDDWAHEGKYDLVLQAAHQDDQRIGEFWKLMQANPQYRDKVTFIVTTDHGRGSGLKLWRDHDHLDGAENIWIAVIGPDTPAKGEMTNVLRVTQSQIAATIAELLGEDYRNAVPKAALPLPIVH